MTSLARTRRAQPSHAALLVKYISRRTQYTTSSLANTSSKGGFVAVRDPLFVNGVDQQEARAGLAALWTPGASAFKAKTGLRPGPSSPAAVTATGTPDGNVHIAPFALIIDDARATSGSYVLVSDTTVDLNVFGGAYGAPAHASLARNDLVIAYPADIFHGDANSTPVVRTVVGTPSGSPADPSLSAYPSAVTLARIRVDAGVTTIPTAKITDLRPTWTVSVGGILPVATQSARDALTGAYDGMPVYRQDRNWVEIRDSSAWRVQGVAVVSSTGDLAAITNPETGQIAYNTGDLLFYRYSGSAWRVRGTYSVTQTLGASAASVTFSSIPSYLKKITLLWSARGDAALTTTAVNLRINGDTGANYAYTIGQVTSSMIFNNATGQTSMAIGHVYGTSGPASIYAGGEVTIGDWDAAHARPSPLIRYGGQDPSAAGFWGSGVGLYSNNGPYTSLTVFPASGNFVATSQFILTGIE